jgi:hypothetical protein
MMSSVEGYEPDGEGQRAVVTESGSAQTRIDAARGALDSLPARPLAEHAGVYEGLHEELQAVLAEIDGA